MDGLQRFGIEEEYFITDLLSRSMVAEPSARVLQACRAAIGEGFAYEMFQGQIEVASPVFDQAAQAVAYLGRVRRDLSQALAEFGLGFICSGTHPLADWQAQRATDQPHAQQLFEDFALVAQRSVLSGLHVHAEIAPGIDRIAVMNELLPWLPMLLALSVSSPLWRGQPSGYCSYRQTACDEWPRMGVPEYLPDERSFQHYLDVLKRSGAVAKDANIWWGCRPSSKYPTLELRMTDACPRLTDALVLAGLFRVMIRHACRLPSPGNQYSLEHHWLFKENRLQARRWGSHGRFVLAPDTAAISLQQWLALAEQRFGETARALGEEGVFAQARQLLHDGTSAERQLRCFAAGTAPAHERSQAVVDLLLAESGAG
ncbi:carboxylate-amine ligase [Pseudomonas mucidolens]|uniref:Putative glutamate--cysteine ligase 2 n=1 Tax=Pseudomonas mucidolens TaxID=46679 RepID=A0A1H2MQZ5_9PSED|nr:carboxylate-amine ligase [Pseudomonas mucidolens]SDU95633.1 carboxylate-amine ligase [Pseudomonas mucidolens]SQH33392.1 glutamate--cysteine ligase [Pseudomonas mucidolens]